MDEAGLKTCVQQVRRDEEKIVAFRPTRLQRFWHALGFIHHRLEDEREPLYRPRGWMKNETHIGFGLADRLRIFLSGRFTIEMIHETNHDAGEERTEVIWRIKPPGEAWEQW